MRLLVAVVVSGMLLLLPISSENEQSSSLIAWASLSADTCILWCDDAGASIECVPAENEHFAQKEGDRDEYGDGWHYTCYSGDCAEKHPRCTQSLAALDDLKQNVAAKANMAEYVALVERHADSMAITKDGLSMYDCDGELMAHLPRSVLGE